MIVAVLFLALALVYVALGYLDYTTYRLPNALVAVATVLSVLLNVAMGHAHGLWVAAVWPVIYFFLWRRGTGLGGGDVKLAVSTGVVASISEMMGVLAAMFVANLLSVCAGMMRRRAVAHGPHMMVAAVGVFLVAVLT